MITESLRAVGCYVLGSSHGYREFKSGLVYIWTLPRLHVATS